MPVKKRKMHQNIRLKTDQINEMMLFYLRCHMKRGPTELWDQYEVRVLKFYEQIILYILKNRKYSLDE